MGHPHYSIIITILTHQRSKSRWAHLHSLHPNGFLPFEFSQIALHLKNNPCLALCFFFWTQRASLCDHNLSSYSTLIHILVRRLLKHQALIRVSGSQNEKPELDPLKVFETLIKTYRQCSEGKECGVDIVAYNTKVGGFCGIGEVEKAEEFFREMGLSGIDSSATTYEHFVKGYCRVGNVDSAMLVYKDMLRKGFSLEALTMEGLIRRICEKSRGFEALEILRGAKRQFRFCRTRKSFEFLVMELCREGKMEEALKIQREMVSEGLEPSCEIYVAFINGYMEQGNVEMAEKLRIEMLEIGV